MYGRECCCCIGACGDTGGGEDEEGSDTCAGCAGIGGAIASNAANPARAISSSRPGALPPLTPMPPTVAPPMRMGQPPAAIMNLPCDISDMLEAKPGMPAPHWATASVDWLNMTAVHALARLMLPVAQPYGDIIRSNTTRCPPESTIAMLTGLLNSLAR